MEILVGGWRWKYSAWIKHGCMGIWLSPNPAKRLLKYESQQWARKMKKKLKPLPMAID